MARKHADGSVTLSPGEVAWLTRDIERWEQASHLPGLRADLALVDLGCDVREILKGESDDS